MCWGEADGSTRVEKQIKDQDAVALKKKEEVGRLLRVALRRALARSPVRPTDALPQIMTLQREFQALQPPSAVPAK